MFRKVLASSRVAELVDQIERGGVVNLIGVWGSCAPLLSAAIAAIKNTTVLIITANDEQADLAACDIETLTNLPAEVFPSWEIDLIDTFSEGKIEIDHLNDEVTGERMRICTQLANRATQPGSSPMIIVASIAALLQPVPNNEALSAGRLTLRKGMEIDPQKLAEWLVEAGFESVGMVDQQGQFARRGGIIDIFPPARERPIRVEFFGEEIESIRKFDLDTQRSIEEVNQYDLISITTGKQIERTRVTSLFDYLPAGAVVSVIEPTEVRSTADILYRRASEIYQFEPSKMLTPISNVGWVEISAFPNQSRDDVPTISMGVKSLEVIAGGQSTSPSESLNKLDALAENNDVWVYFENSAEQERFFELTRAGGLALTKRVHTGVGHINSGFYWPDEHLIVVGYHQILHRYVYRRPMRRIRRGRPIESLLDLNEGDYVVHILHGIARFESLQTIKTNGRVEEYLTLRFANRAILHVPVSDIHLIQKYIGVGRRRPALSRLGGRGWSLRKQRVARATRDLAIKLLQIQAIREASEGISFPEGEMLSKFEQEFAYVETPDQITAMREIYADMAKPRPMDRLLCGDVGYGKTELAMRAAFRAVEAGKQVAVLVPTTVLADQHWRTFTERFADYPVIIEVVSRFRRPREIDDILKRTAEGKVDILIGTHRLLSPDVKFSDLGLVIIDEEQRFGVEHKERLKRLRATVDVLTLTATPIPRTLHMALMGLKDISNLTTAPLDRRAIYTELCKENDAKIRAAILREMARSGQVFFVHNRVATIDKVAEHLRQLVPEARIAVAHGQMPERQLEQTMLKFVNREIDVLVCTTIIESGLDIPTANTMFIHEADRFGLAQLHQLRGRIGRYKHRAYCYLLLPKHRKVSRTAARRLKTIEDFSDLGAGFQIAMRDLEIRGAGNILGPEQSGHIAAVGYELYCQLLQQAVAQLKGQSLPAPPVRCHVELAIDAYIPRGYIPSDRQRLEIYRRLRMCHSIEEVKELADDLRDAFGPIPPIVDRLITMTEIEILAGKVGFEKIILLPPDVIFSISEPTKVDSVLKDLPGSVRFADNTTAHWRPPARYLEKPTLLTVLRRRLQQAVKKI